MKEGVSPMKENAGAMEQAREFFRVWLCRRDPEAASRYLSDDIGFVGTGSGEEASGFAAMREYLIEDCRQEPEPFHIIFLHPWEQAGAEGCACVKLEVLLQNKQYSWRLRFSLLLRLEGGCWRICHIHASEAAGSRQGPEHYPRTLVVENLNRQRNELLNEAIAGGMIGGYREPGLPLYFVNRWMLNYLGYDSEEDFVGDIAGMIENGIHPEDRAELNRQIAQQLAATGEYAVEYRMRKKNGEYIWVHDIGRGVTAENGRPAVMSVCVDITALRAAQEDRRQLLDTIPGAVLRCRYTEELEVLDTSDGLYDITGYGPRELAGIGNRLSALLAPEDAKKILPTFQTQMAAGARTVYAECRLNRRDGAVIWISLRGHLTEEVGGSNPVLFCVLTDATEQVEERARVRRRFQREIDHATDLTTPNLIAKAQADLTEDSFESYSGLGGSAMAAYFATATVDQAMRHIADSAATQEDAARFLEQFSRRRLTEAYAAGETDHSVEYRRRRVDGKLIWCRTVGRTYLTPETNHLTLFIYSFDITEEWLTRRLLEQASIMDYDFLMDVDIENNLYHIAARGGPNHEDIPDAGKFYEGCLKVSAAIPGASRPEFFRQLDFDNIRSRLEESPSYSFTIPSHAGGRLRYKKHSLSYIDKLTGHVCLSRVDITDIIENEQRQQEALRTALQAARQASIAKRDFLSRMSHEIRTPLNAVIGMTAIAASAVDDPREVADCLEKIGVSSRFLLSLINDILDMSRIESGKLLLKREPFSLKQMICNTADIIRAQAGQKGMEFECVLGAGLGEGYVGDEMKLQQVLVNILSNAVKFTSAGGKVTFSAEEIHRGKSDATLRFVIRDTGIGIDPDFLPRVFDAFAQESGGSTTLYGGTGLGLAISKNIVDMMNGQITVRSLQDVGSEFTVDVRLEPGPEELLSLDRDLPCQGMRCLVVDDDAAVCQSTVQILRELGAAAEGAEGGLRAIERTKELLGRHECFSTILLDWKMPELDGVETARRLRAMTGPETAIFLMTAYDSGGIEQGARAAGVDALLEKPLFRSTLESALSRAYSGKAEPGFRPAEEYSFQGRRILLAEDHPLNIEIAVKLLERVGFQVDAAVNGLKALELFKKSRPGYYDAVLMDIRMPLMDGLTAAAAIRNLDRPDAATTPILAMTANAFENDMEKSMAAGMNAHLAKPIEPEALYRALESFLRKGKSGRA